MVRRATRLATPLLIALAVLSGWKEGNTAGEPAVPQGFDRGSPPAVDAKRLEDAPLDIKEAGVCGRCHVVSVLEWGVSGHRKTETDCQECHGPSREHVADERNEAKPDRTPRGEAIAQQLCSTCHDAGCPKTLEVQTCQKCHHVHALVHPSAPPPGQGHRTDEDSSRWRRFAERMEEGEGHVKREDWKAAQAAFRAALRWIPGSDRARRRLEMCSRRLQPDLPGFTMVGGRFDEQTGLPRQVRVAGLEMEMLLVPPGEFDMGAEELPDSRPVHTVRIEAHYLGRCEVTQSQWRAVMGGNPSAHQGEDFPSAERLPVERVSWEDCQAFLQRLNRRVAGGGFRLPTEAEWEYACRAGSDAPAAGELAEFAWFRGNSLRAARPEGGFLGLDAYAPRPVGGLRPNAWGMHDMQGNAWEWCSSIWRPHLDQAAGERDSPAQTGLRVLRGGGYADSAELLDPALRHAERPHRRFRWNGLRLARTAPLPDQRPKATSQQAEP